MKEVELSKNILSENVGYALNSIREAQEFLLHHSSSKYFDMVCRTRILKIMLLTQHMCREPYSNIGNCKQCMHSD
jgi:hypothetical protein